MKNKLHWCGLLIALRRVGFLQLFQFVLFTGVSLAQTVSGKVTSDAGEALPGVNILLKGTTTGTISNVDGTYSLNVTVPNPTLIFSFIGFTTQEIPLNGRTTLNVALGTDVHALSEVVGLRGQREPGNFGLPTVQYLRIGL
jgi:hypothetical protein